MATTSTERRDALLHRDGWAGHTTSPVVVVGDAGARWEITPAGPERVRLAGRQRWLEPGHTAFVPKHAVTFPEAP